MARNGLEERLEAITREFVGQIVGALRSASFADVAALQLPASSASRAQARPASKSVRVSASPKRTSNGASSHASSPSGGAAGGRQTAEKRAEIGERVVRALESHAGPMSARAISSEIGIAVDLLSAPLLELRAAGRISKHGEKRATTYTIA